MAWLGDLTDGAVIIAIVVINALIGFFQEYHAGKSLDALRRMTAPRAKVRREGKSVVIAAAEIVPGDVIEVLAGDVVAADARVIKAAGLSCVESALTGESEAVEKIIDTISDKSAALGDRKNMLFSGTSVASGQGHGVVTATGMSTEMGRVAGLLAETADSEETPLQSRLGALGRSLVWLSLGIVFLIFVLGSLRGVPMSEMFLSSVSLAVAAVPEGLPAVVTVALALGVMRMSRHRALMRRLSAVETLGATGVICTDKTGTLTVGEMTVREIYVAGSSFSVTGEGYGPNGEVLFEGRATEPRHAGPLLELGNILIGCNNAELILDDGGWRIAGDPTEAAMLSAGHKAGARRETIEQNHPKHHEIPFDSIRKRRTVVRLLPDGRLRAQVNGAPDELVGECSQILGDDGPRAITDEDRRGILAENERMASGALRVLGAAYRDLDHAPAHLLSADVIERDLVFVGLTGMQDPPRAEARQSVAECHSAGVRVVMITGDQPHTARAIASELGIISKDERVMSGVEISAIPDDELRELVPQVAVYARVTPEHKLRIVRAWQARGSVVAMTGDGVNDAPAIKAADIGIAMGRGGTDVAREAADMVITDDNFATIVRAVEAGRGIFENIRKSLLHLLAGNAGEILVMTACVIAGLPLPLLPVHLLWINLLTDSLPALCLAIDPADPAVMSDKPRARDKALADSSFWRTVAFTGGVVALVVMAVFLFSLHHGSLDIARTHAFTALVFADVLRAFGGRSRFVPVWRISLLTNPWLLAIVASTVALQTLMITLPSAAAMLQSVVIPAADVLVLLLIAFLPALALEIRKVLMRRTIP